MGKVTACGGCGGRDLAPVLDLGHQPLAERDDGRRYPLIVLECAACTLAQLSYIVDQREVFPPDHPYATGNTRALREHFAGLAAKVAPLLGPGDLAVDIGANDGTFLAALRGSAPHARLLAVEPTRQVRKCRTAGIAAVEEFFTGDVAEAVTAGHGRAKVITAANVLAHVPDVHDFLDGVAGLLAPGGTFITENHDWDSVATGLQVDTVYHEHLRYYTVASLSRLLAAHGLVVRSAEPVATHGGSFRVTAGRQASALARRAERAREALHALVRNAAAEGPVYGIGAATRATPLIHWAGIASCVACVCEVAGSEKIGSSMPGTSIAVVDEAKLIADQPPYALLFAWHIAADLVPKLRAAGYRGRFIVPLPEARVIDG